MSKMDNLRAMREARFERASSAQPKRPAPARATVARAAEREAAPAAQDSEEQVEGLCGHRNMSGRTCTRERGHAAKSHRYS